MILSRTAVYAIRAMLHLAEQEQSMPVRADDVADALGIPRNYLSKILHTLARRGLLESSRGPNGGFRLTQPSKDMTLLSVVQCFSEDMGKIHCLLGRAECLDEDPCPAHASWKGVAAAIRVFFHDTTVADLIKTNPPGGANG